MPRTIMISGPHGIGKTTTASALVRHLEDAMLMPSIAGKVAAKLGYDLNKSPKPIETLAYQETVLAQQPFLYSSTLLVDTVFDRSPLDWAVYTTIALRDFPEYTSRLVDYVGRCVDLTKRYCDVLIIPHADLTLGYEDKGNRPSFDSSQVSYRQDYAELLDYLVDQVSPSIDVIDVPVDKQFGERVEYIMERLPL